MDLAIIFNDAGCRLYQRGRGQEAYELFSGAMQAMHHSCGGKTRTELDSFSRQLLLVDPSVQRAFDHIESSGALLSENPMGDDEKDEPPSKMMKPENGGKEFEHSNVTQSIDSHFMWTEVFAIQGLQYLPCGPGVYFSMAMSIILYNEALMLHRGHVFNSRRCLERALTFYSMSGRALLENCPRDTLESHNYTAILCCGILNNTGYLLHQMGDFQASRLCYARMNEFLLRLRPPKSAEEKLQREEFGLNFILFFRSLSTAAAA